MKPKPITKSEMEKFERYVVMVKEWGMEPKSAKEWLENYRSVRDSLNRSTSWSPKKTVRCFACGHEQEDRGRRKTCVKCGVSPLPSYSYERDNAFHPHYDRDS